MNEQNQPFETPARATHQVLYVRLDNPELGMACVEFSDGTFRRVDTMQPWAPDQNWRLEERMKIRHFGEISAEFPAPGGHADTPPPSFNRAPVTEWPQPAKALSDPRPPAGAFGLDSMQLEGLSEFAAAMAAQLAPDDDRKQALITEGVRALWFRAMGPPGRAENPGRRRRRDNRYLINTDDHGRTVLWDFETLKDIAYKVEFHPQEKTISVWTGKGLVTLTAAVADRFYDYLKSLDTGVVF